MFYPIHVHKEKGSAYGAAFPDFPAALPQLTTGKICRAPRKPSRRTSTARPKQFPRRPLPKHGPAMRTSRGYWMMVDIDLSKVSTKAVRLNISLPRTWSIASTRPRKPGACRAPHSLPWPQNMK